MEKQKKLKFNLVDVIFILVLLAGVAFVALRISGVSLSDLTNRAGSDHEDGAGPDADDEEEMYIITFYTAESADYVVGHLQLGSQLTDDGISLDLGTLVDFETAPARISSAAADGHLVISDREGYSSVYLMSRVQGIDNGFGVTVDGLKLEIGHSMVVRAQESKFWVYVYDIQKLDETPYVNSKIPNADYFHRDDEDK